MPSDRSHATVEVARKGHLRVLQSVELADEPGDAREQHEDRVQHDMRPPGALGTYDDPFGAHLEPRLSPAREELVREPFHEDGLPFDDD